VGVVHKVGNGKWTQFWDDVWIKESPLRICFPKIYSICRETHMSDSKGGDLGWQLDLRRMMGPKEMEEWEELMKVLEEGNLNNEDDTILLGLTANKMFST
jgi:hypothetical protein